MIPFRNLLLVLASGVGLILAGCGQKASAARETATVQAGPGERSSPAVPEGKPAQTNAVLYTYQVVKTWPHDPRAFTQGLVFMDGQLLESTGLNGQSTLRRVALATGLVLKQVEVPAQYFAEGLAILDGKAFQLTWQNHKGFVYDLKTFKLEREFTYSTEGWGLTTDGHSLIMSDGSSQIRFLDPATFKAERTINVTHRTWPVDRLNELEFIKGEIYANIWGADFVVRINPRTGIVTGIIDFSGLLPVQERTVDTDVLNGIAYDAKEDRLFVTGKRWPKLYEVRLKPK